MRGKIVAFRVYRKTNEAAKNSQATMNRFVQKFYGQDTTTHNGKYRHHKRGLLEDIAHVRLIRGVIILQEKDLDTVLKFLDEFNAEVHVREVTLTPEDEKTLSKND